MTIKCPKCHSENTDTAWFCSNCATRLTQAGQPSPFLTKTLKSPAHVLSKGSLIAGKYRIFEEIGQDGMGRIYKVQDTKIKEKIALMKGVISMKFVSQFLILFATFACANLASVQQRGTFPPVSIPLTEVRNLYSSIVRDTFEISIALPKDYNSKDTTYPILYMTDANIAFLLGTQIARDMELSGFEELPDIIIVGIGYRTMDQWRKLRFRDLAPTPHPNIPLSGGGPLFLRFIKEELMPFIRKNYRVSNDASYEGYSYGGVFGLYVLFHEPELFSRYIIGSPWLEHDNFVTLKYESDYASTHRDLPAKVFMSVGEFEETQSQIGEVSRMKLLSERLQQRHYPSLMLETKVFEGETHLSGVAATISRGLRVIYRRQLLKKT